MKNVIIPFVETEMLIKTLDPQQWQRMVSEIKSFLATKGDVHIRFPFFSSLLTLHQGALCNLIITKIIKKI